VKRFLGEQQSAFLLIWLCICYAEGRECWLCRANSGLLFLPPFLFFSISSPNTPLFGAFCTNGVLTCCFSCFSAFALHAIVCFPGILGVLVMVAYEKSRQEMWTAESGGSL
jgi:hypothetical protein